MLQKACFVRRKRGKWPFCTAISIDIEYRLYYNCQLGQSVKNEKEIGIMNKENKKSLHYGWVIVFVGFVIMCFVVCIVSNCVGMFVTPVSESMGITRQQFSLTTTFYAGAGILLSAFIGSIYRRFTIKRVMMFSSVVLCAAYACYSIAPNIYVFYVISFITGLRGCSLTMIAISTLMANWFNEKRGLAIALASTGSGVGGVFMNPLIGRLITSVGWRQTYLILAVLMAVTVIPCTFFLVKDTPADKGLGPYGGVAKAGAVNAALTGMTAAQARKTPSFWMWCSICIVVSASCTCVMQHSVSYITDLGYEYTFAAGMASVITASLAIGKIIMGQVFDMVGSRLAGTISLSMFFTAFVLYGFAENVYILYIATAIIGFGLSFSTVAYSVVTQDLFGKKDYAGIYGSITVFSSLGSALGSPVIAGVYDSLGSYKLAWNGLALLMAYCIVILNVIFYIKKKSKDKEEKQSVGSFVKSV